MKSYTVHDEISRTFRIFSPGGCSCSYKSDRHEIDAAAMAASTEAAAPAPAVPSSLTSSRTENLF